MASVRALALSPGPSQFFFFDLQQKKNERGPGIQSHLTKLHHGWHDAIKKAWPIPAISNPLA